MSKTWNTSVAGIAGLLLVLGGSSRANEADDLIHRFAVQAREQAAAQASRDVSRTLDEIAKVVPSASPDGIAETKALLAYLADLRATVKYQATDSAAAPDAEAAAARQPVQEPPAPPSTTQDAARIEPLSPSLPSPPPPVLPLAPAPDPMPDPPARPAASPASAALLDLLRRQGDAALRRGDVSGARRFYGRGAETGCGACAEALARTYDADELRRMGTVGIKADPAQAAAWRVRARQLSQAGAP